MIIEKREKNVEIHQKCTHTIKIVCVRGNAGAHNNNLIKMRAFKKKALQAACIMIYYKHKEKPKGGKHYGGHRSADCGSRGSIARHC